MQGGAEGSFFREIQNQSGVDLPFSTVGELVGNLLPYIFYLAGIALLIYMILGGFQLMFAKGDPKAVEGAKGKITNALIGFVVVFISYWVVKLLGSVFGIADFF